MTKKERTKEKSQSIGRGFAILSFSSIAVKILSLFFVPVMRKLLGGSYGYGVYGAASEVYAFVYVITTSGMPVAVSKIVSELTSQDNPREAERSFRLARFFLIILGIFSSILMAVFAKPIAALMNNEDSWAGILFLAPSIMICSIMAAYRGYFQGKRNMTPTAVSQIIEQIVHVAVSIICVIGLRHHGIVWAVAGASIGTSVGAFVSFAIIVGYRSSRRYYIEKESRRGRNLPTKKLLKTLVYYSIPITLSSGIQYGGNLIDASLIASRLQAGGFSEVVSTSLYGDMIATRQLINVPTALVSALCVSVLPALTASYARQDFKGTEERAGYGFKLLYIVAMPLSFAMAVFSKEIYTLLGFGNNHMLLTSLSFSILLMGTVHLQNSIMQSVNRLFQSTMYLGVSVLVKALLNYILIAIPVFNVYGAVISTYIAYAIPLVLNHRDLVKRVSIKVNPARRAVLPLIASFCMIVCAYVSNTVLNVLFSPIGLANYLKVLVTFLPTIFVGVYVYFKVLIFFGGITEEDLNSISPALGKVMRKITKR
ncbi:MAG: polysaccharide biosynthesis protein [Clostridiaceae bacterium]|nr:polysaccharide biosynthesis protein [Clostridiaceae bacterium]